MKKILLALALTVSALGAQAAPSYITNSADASLTGSSLIDFNSEAFGSFTSRSFGGAVTFSSPSSLFIESTYSGQYGSSGRYLANQSNPNPVTLTFASAVSAFGFSWGAADQPWTLEVFDTASVLLATFNVPAQTSPYAAFIGVNGGGANIGSARLTDLSSYGFDYFLLDDLQYVAGGSTSVPEPAGIALLGMGLAGLAFARRRKSAK